MTFKVGRVDLGDRDIKWSVSGAVVQVSGTTDMDRQLASQTRQQLTGYVDNPDEEFVPVTWDEEPHISGFYRVRSAAVDGEGFIAYSGGISWSVTLERVLTYAAPSVEVATVAANRVNSVSFANPYQTVCLPGSAENALFRSPVTSNPVAADYFRVGEDGRTAVFRRVLDLLGRTSFAYQVEPQDHYEGAARVSVNDDAGVPQIVTGRYGTMESRVVSISNGVFEVRVVPTVSPTPKFLIETRAYLPSGGWSDPQTYDLRMTATLYRSPVSMVVMRNSPEVVSVRLRSTPPSGFGSITADVTLRRGDRFATFATATAHDNLTIFSTAATGSTAGTGYYEKTVGPVRALFITGEETVPGGFVNSFYPNPLNRFWNFGIGLVPESATHGSAGGDGRFDAVGSYFLATAQRQSVVAS